VDIFKIVMIGLVAALLASIIKEQKPQVAVMLGMATGIIIFLLMLSKVTLVIQALQNIASKADINVVYLNTVLKIIGISYIASLGVELCKDAGQNSIAGKIEFAGKILIIVLALPILMAVMDLIIQIMP
jgi:stage III sporulation protein AD